MKTALVHLALAALLCGCYSSSSLEGDGGGDPLPDPAPDAAADTMADPRPDPPGDPAADRDVMPDPIHDPWLDGPMEIPAETADIVPDTPIDGPHECPPRGEVSARFIIDGETWPMEEFDFELRCRIESVTGEEEGHTIITLACFSSAGTEENHTIDIAANPPAYLYMWEGEDVIFSYNVNQPWWVNRWFTLRYAWGQLALAGVDATRLAPWGVELEEWYNPLSIMRVEGLCPLSPGDCGMAERTALDVRFGGAASRVFDGSTGFVGFMESFQIIVDKAVVQRELWCDDFPDQWFSALFVMIPEG
ncbi:MAG: hypothetical protein ABIJ56_02020 [Pseudomonadota bacterium]